VRLNNSTIVVSSQVVPSMCVAERTMSTTSQTTVLKLKKYIAKSFTRRRLGSCIGIEPQVWRNGPPLSGVSIDSSEPFQAISCNVHSPSAIGVSPIEHHRAKQASYYASLLCQGSLLSVHCLSFQNSFLCNPHGPDPK